MGESNASHGSLRGLAPALRCVAADLVDLGVTNVFTVPGSPATGLVDELTALGAHVLDAHNEATAAELAFGMSTAGTACAVVVKGNGALLCAEPLQNAGPHRTVAPLLLIVGDDVDATSSTVPTDARLLGAMLHVPVFDLDPDELRRPTLRTAVTTARATERPVIVRFTGGFARASVPTGSVSDEVPLPLPAGAPAPAPGLPGPFELTKRSRFVQYAVARADELEALALEAPVLHRSTGAAQAVVAVGATWVAVGDAATPADWDVVRATTVHPLAAGVVEACLGLTQVVVLEEGEPVVEDALRLALDELHDDCRVLGQRSGHVPALGPRSSEDVARAVAGQLATEEPLARRAPDTDPDQHEYRTLFEALRQLDGRAGLTVHTCVGSCISAAYAPYAVADTALNLGGAIAVAAGHAMATGSPAIALIGDYGLVHSAVPAHQLVVAEELSVLTIVLANDRSAKTGDQPSGSGVGEGAIDLEQLVRTVAREHEVVTRSVESLTVPALLHLLVGLLDRLPATLLLTAGLDDGDL